MIKFVLKKLPSNVVIVQSFSQISDFRSLLVNTTQNVVIRALFQSYADVTKRSWSCFLHSNDRYPAFLLRLI